MKAKSINAEQYEQARKALFETLPPISQDVVNWVENYVLGLSRYMFAYREKYNDYGYCTHCKKEVFLNFGERLRHNEVGSCPNCGSRVVFKDAGRGHKRLFDKEYIIIAQPLTDRGIAVRAFEVFKDFTNEYKGVDTLYRETYRIYFNKGIDCAFKSYCEHYRSDELTVKALNENYNSNFIRWARMKAIPNPALPTAFYVSNRYEPKFYGFEDWNLENTYFKYAQVKEYKNLCIKTDPVNVTLCSFLDMYVKHPEITEKLMKEGFGKIIWQRLSPYYSCTPKIDLRKKTVSKALGLNKAQVRECRDKWWQEIEEYMFCQKYNLKSKRELSFVKDANSRSTLLDIEKYVPVRKAIKYLINQNKGSYIYRDYLSECKKLNLNLESKDVLFPESLIKAHEHNIEALQIISDREKAKSKKEQNENFKNKFLKKWNKLYQYEDESLLIRPAQGYADLLKEGRELHHCVAHCYSDDYLNGRTIILFIRQKSDPNKPYYTMELGLNERMIQCRGYKNAGMTEEVKAFTNHFLEHIKNQHKKVNAA